jgi:hypothetical protein
MAMMLVAMVAAPQAVAATDEPVHRAAATGPAPATAPLTPAATLAGRGFIRQRLIRLGHNPSAAEDAVRRLTGDDVAVLMANPKMLQPAGTADVGTEVALGTVFVICIFVGLALGGASVVIISG